MRKPGFSAFQTDGRGFIHRHFVDDNVVSAGTLYAADSVPRIGKRGAVFQTSGFLMAVTNLIAGSAYAGERAWQYVSKSVWETSRRLAVAAILAIAGIAVFGLDSAQAQSPMGTITLSVEQMSVVEGDTDTSGGESTTTTVQVTAALDAAQDQQFDVTIEYSGMATGQIEGEAAVDDPDYLRPSGNTLTFAAMDTMVQFNIEVYPDRIPENDEDIVITLSAPTLPGIVMEGNADTTAETITITDDDGATFSIFALPDAVEGDMGVENVPSQQRQVFRIEMSKILSVPILVNFQITGTAKRGEFVDLTVSSPSPGADYLFYSGIEEMVEYASYLRRVTIDPGETVAFVEARVVGDRIPESNETIVLSLSLIVTGTDFERYQLRVSPTAGDATYTIINDDGTQNSVSLASSGGVVEGASGSTQRQAVAFTIRLDRPADADVLVDYSFGGTASGQYGSTSLAGADFLRSADSVSTGTFRFPAGSTVYRVTADVVGDDLAEPDESITLSLNNLRYADGSSYDLSLSKDASTATFTIVNDDMGQVSDALPVISIDHTRVVESVASTSTVNLRLQLSEISSQPVMVDYAISGGTATAHFGAMPPSDVDISASAQTGTVTIDASQIDGLIPISVFDDHILESGETVILTLSNPVNAAIDVATSTALTILNDDMQLTPSIDQRVGENSSNGTVSITFSLTGANMIEGMDVRAATFKYRVLGGTATPGVDYLTSEEDSFSSSTEGSHYIDINHVSNPNAFEKIDRFGFFVVNDDIAEPDETIIVEFYDAVGVELVGSRAVTTIVDNDADVLWIDAPPDAAEGDQGSTKLTFQAKLNVARIPTRLNQGEEVTVDYVIEGSATEGAGEDYQGPAGTRSLTFTGTEKTKNIVVSVNGDTDVESDETVVVRLLNASGAILDSDRRSATARILDDDEAIEPPSPTEFSISSPSAAEGPPGTTASLDFIVTRHGDATAEASVEYTVVAAGSTATASEDYTIALADGTVEFSATETSKTIPVTVNGDNLHEGDETVRIMLFNPTGGAIRASEGTGIGTITGDDPLTLSVTVAPVDEGDAGTSQMQYTATLASRSSGQVTVQYSLTTDGSATVGTDFQSISDNTLAFAAGETEMSFTVTVTGDTDPEEDETVVVRFFNLTGGATFADGAVLTEIKVQGTIRNDDSPVISSSPATVSEGADGNMPTLRFTVTLSTEWDEEVTVGYAVTGGTAAGEATAGEDFHDISGTLSFTPASGGDPGETSKNVDVTVIGDDYDEANETVTLTLSNASSNALLPTTEWTGTITDDDALPVFSISSLPIDEGDTGTSTLTFMVTKQGLTRRQTSVRYAIADGATDGATGGSAADDDYVPKTAGQLMFAHDETVKSIEVTVRGDDLAEADETVTATLSTPSLATFQGGGTTLVGTGTIVNDDHLTVSIEGEMVDEGADQTTTPLAFTVTLAARSTGQVTVDYEILTSGSGSGTATHGTGPGGDYTAASLTGTLTFLANTAAPQTLTFEVSVSGDSDSEMNETVVARLHGLSSDATFPGNPPPTEIFGMGTIVNDDSPTFTVNSPTVTEGADEETSTLVFAVTISPSIDETVMVGYAVAGSSGANGATAGEDFIATTGTLTYLASETMGTVSVTVVGDDFDEADEEVTLTLSGASPNARIQTASWTGVIVDDDALPVFSISSLPIDEGDAGTSTLTFMVTKQGLTRRDTSVNFTISDGSTDGATGGLAADDDYVPKTGGPLAFAHDETDKSIEVTVRGDDLAEADETVTATLSTPSLATFQGGGATLVGTGTIVNDDHLRISIDSPDWPEGDSGTQSRGFMVSLAARSLQPVTVAYSIGGTADEGTGGGADYSVASVSGTLTFLAGVAAPQVLPIPVSVFGDTDSEADETVVVTLSSAACAGCAQAAEIAVGTGTGTIVNDDSPTFAVDRPAVAEGAGGESTTLDFTVTMSPGWHEPVTVRYSIAGGSGEGGASAGEDFVEATGLLTFAAGAGGAAGETVKTVSVEVVGDDYDEADEEEVTLTLFDASANARITQSNWTGVIEDDDALPVFSIDSPRIEEGDSDTSLLAFLVTKQGLTRRQTSVDFAVADGATSGATGGMDDGDDYFPVSGGRLPFAPGDTEMTVAVTVRGDDLAEADETLTATLSNPSLATLAGGEATLAGRGTIVNDDHLLVTIDSPEVDEGAAQETSALVFTVTLAARSSAAVTVGYEVVATGEDGGTATHGTGPGGDYTAASLTGTLTFAADTAAPQTRTVEVSVSGDGEAEAHETVVVRLHSPAAGARFSGDPPPGEIFAAGTIRNDDSPTFLVDSPEVFEGDEGPSTLTFTVALSQVWDDEVSVAYELSGGEEKGQATVDDDFEAKTGTLVYAAGETSKTVEVTVLGDLTVESDESVTLTLSEASDNAQITQEAWTGVILSDDYALSAAAAPASLVEPSSGQTAGIAFMVTLDDVWSREVEVAYELEGTASEGVDYTNATTAADSGAAISGRLTFPAGARSRSARVSVNADIVDEGVETVAIDVLSLAGTSLGAAESVISPPLSSPDAVLTVAPLRTSTIDAESLAVLRVHVEGGGRDFDVRFDWRVTRIGEGAPGSGGVASAAVDVLADSSLAGNEAGVNDPGQAPAGGAFVDVTATLGAEIAPGDLLGFEIFGLDCAPGLCAVSQDSVALEFRGMLSPGASPAGTAVAAVVETIGNDLEREAQTHALAGFGRAMASSVIGGVWRRTDAHRADSFESTFIAGGRAVDAEVLASGDAGRAAREVAGLLGVETVSPSDLPLDGGIGALADWTDGDLDDWRARTGVPDSAGLSERSRFALSLGERTAAKTVTLWGEGTVSGFESEPMDGVSLESGESTGLLGVDVRAGGYLVGVAVSRFRGDSDYEVEGLGPQPELGSMKASLSGTAPYLHWLHSEGLGIWASGALASGTLELESARGMVETDLSMRMMAIGVRGAPKRLGDADMFLRGDFFLTQTRAKQAPGFDELNVEASRIRLALEGVLRQELDGGGVTTSRFELGARVDFGEGEEGGGADTAGEIRYASPGGGLEMAGRASALMLHEQNGFQEWGAGLDIGYTFPTGGRGARFSLEPRWNTVRMDAADSLWNEASTGSGIDGRNAGISGASLLARFGYGIGALRDRALATPYGLAETGGDSQKLRLGVEFEGLEESIGRLRLDAYGERREKVISGDERRIMLEGRFGL